MRWACSACGELIAWEWESAVEVMLHGADVQLKHGTVKSGLEYKAEVRTAEVGSEVRLE